MKIRWKNIQHPPLRSLGVWVSFFQRSSLGRRDKYLCDLFEKGISRINEDMGGDDISRLLSEIKLSLENEDLGKAFYEKLVERTGLKTNRLWKFI